MSLTMCIGLLADLKDSPEDAEDIQETLGQINQILETHGLPAHQEPDDFPEDDEDGYWNFTIRYGFVADFALAVKKRLDDGELDLAPECVAHLTAANPEDGFWVPLDFPQVLLDGEIKVASSYRLKEICEAMAPLLGLSMALDEIPFDYSGEGEELEEYFAENLGDARMTPEAFLCIILYQAACISIKNRMLIMFG